MTPMVEQHQNGDLLDNRADVWALSVLLHEMLTGELVVKFVQFVANRSAAGRETRPLP